MKVKMMKNSLHLSRHILLVIFVIPSLLCDDNDIKVDQTSTRTESATVTLNSTSTDPSTVISSSPSSDLPKETISSTSKYSPSTTDVCGLSLVLPSEQNGIKPQKCKCSNLNEDVDCSYLGVTQLPKLISFPKVSRVVSFEGNKIENINEDTFYNGKSVLELDLSHNRIDFISSIAFQSFKSLRILGLSHNRIWNMPLKSFHGLNELKYLDLSYNDITSIPSDLFADTTDLRNLILKSNPLQELDPKMFEHLPKLEFLSLSSTLLKVIPDHIFIFTPHLKNLDLSNNQLTEVPTAALKELDYLKTLELSGNPIHTIPEKAFVGMRGLVLLYLDQMPVLTKIEKYAFGDLQMLQELHCSYNFLLSKIDEHAFVRKIDNQKVRLSQLFLRQNDLYTLPKDLLVWSDDVELRIEENPIACDCHAEWMVNLKLKNDFQSHVKCTSPSYLEGMYLNQLKDHTLSCGLDVSEIVMITVAVVIAVLVFALIVAFLVWRRSYAGYSRPYFKVSKRKHVQEVDYTGDDL